MTQQDTQPPAETLDDREAVARIINPSAWPSDEQAAAYPDEDWDAAKRAAFAKTDRILATLIRRAGGDAIPAVEVDRLQDAEALFKLILAANDEHALLDAMDNDGTEYQSAFMAGLMVHIRGWLRPNDIADRVAAYRASLTPQPPAGGNAGVVDRVTAAIKAEIDAPLTGPTHGAWDRGRIGGLRDALAIIRETVAALALSAPVLEGEKIYVRWSDDGQHIRKWSRTPFDGGQPLFGHSLDHHTGKDPFTGEPVAITD